MMTIENVFNYIRDALIEIFNHRSQKTMHDINTPDFDKVTIYQCGSRVIRIDLHTKKDI